MKILVKIMFLFAILKANSTIVEYLPPDKLVIMTEEFESFRRVVIVVESINDPQLLELKLITGDYSETFDVLLKMKNPTIYHGKRHRQSRGIYPIDLHIIEKDSSTMIVRGLVSRFEKIVSYKLLGENKYYFDIYPKQIEQSTVQQTIILENEVGASGQSKITSLRTPTKEQMTKLPKSVFGWEKSVLIHALLISSNILISVVFLSLIVVVLWKRASKTMNKLVIGTHPEQSLLTIVEDKSMYTAESVRDNVEDRDLLIRKIMVEKKISYDEAIMYLDIKSKKYNASS